MIPDTEIMNQTKQSVAAPYTQISIHSSHLALSHPLPLVTHTNLLLSACYYWRAGRPACLTQITWALHGFMTYFAWWESVGTEVLH